MSGMEVLRYVELVAVILAAGAVIAVSIRGYLLAQRLQRLTEQVSRMVEGEVRQAVTQVEEAAREVHRTAAHLDGTLVPLSSTLHRIERWTAAIAAETLVASALSPALAKVSTWLSGLRRAIHR